MKFIKNHGGRENYYPTKLKKDRTGDCVVRAIAIATEQDYLVVRDDLFEVAKKQGRMPNDKNVWGTYLVDLGWVRRTPMKNRHNRKYKLGNIKIDKAIFKTSKHLAAIIDGNLNDTWDCRNWKANSYWVEGGISEW